MHPASVVVCVGATRQLYSSFPEVRSCGVVDAQGAHIGIVESSLDWPFTG